MNVPAGVRLMTTVLCYFKQCCCCGKGSELHRTNSKAQNSLLSVSDDTWRIKEAPGGISVTFHAQRTALVLPSCS